MAAGVSTSLKTAKGMLGGGIGGALGVAGSVFEFIGDVRSGTNPVVAGAKAAANYAVFATMGFGPALAVTAGFSLVKAGVEAGYAFNQRQSVYMRQVKQPFSHSFQHSDATMAAQQRGLQALGHGRGLIGAEAGVMSQLYGRR